MFSIFFSKVYICIFMLFEVSSSSFIETACEMKIWLYVYKIWWCVWFIWKSFISRNKFLFKNTKGSILNHFKVVSKSNKCHITLPSILCKIYFKYFSCHSCFSRYLLPDKPHILYIKILISKIYRILVHIHIYIYFIVLI